MREICLPIPPIVDDLPINIEIRKMGDENAIYYRIATFLLKANESNNIPNNNMLSSRERINELKNVIETYDKSWELIQIFAPLNNSNSVQVLFRKK